MRLIQIAISILFTITCSLIYAQDKQLTSDSDTAFWKNRYTQLSSELGLPSMENSKEKYEMRFWNDNNVIRLWGCTSDLQGEVIYFLRQHHKHDNYSKYRVGKLYFQKKRLRQQSVKSIEYLISDFGINLIPSMDQIEGWNSNAVHGELYIIEASSLEKFSFKNFKYVHPYPEEARKVNYFFQNINSIEEVESGFEKFINNQPFGKYYDGIWSGEIQFSSGLREWYWMTPRRLIKRIFPPNIDRIRSRLEKENRDK